MTETKAEPLSVPAFGIRRGRHRTGPLSARSHGHGSGGMPSSTSVINGWEVLIENLEIAWARATATLCFDRETGQITGTAASDMARCTSNRDSALEHRYLR